MFAEKQKAPEAASSLDRRLACLLRAGSAGSTAGARLFCTRCHSCSATVVVDPSPCSGSFLEVKSERQTKCHFMMQLQHCLTGRSAKPHLIWLLALRVCHQATSTAQTLGLGEVVPTAYHAHLFYYSYSWAASFYYLRLVYNWPLARRVRSTDLVYPRTHDQIGAAQLAHARGSLDIDRAAITFAPIAATNSDVTASELLLETK